MTRRTFQSTLVTGVAVLVVVALLLIFRRDDGATLSTGGGGQAVPIVPGANVADDSDASHDAATRNLAPQDVGKGVSQDQDALSNEAVITGTVCDRVGRRVLNAEIRFHSATGERSARSIADGTFAIIVGNSRVNGSIRAQLGTATSHELPISVELGRNEIGEVGLLDGSNVVAKLIASDGTPLSGITLAAATIERETSATSDSVGTIRFGVLPAMQTRFSVCTPGWRIVTPSDGLVDLKRAGQLTFGLAQFGTVHGIVRSSTGEPLAGVRVAAESPYSSLSRETISGDSGEYNLELDGVSTWDLSYELKGLPQKSMTSVPGNVGRLDVVLDPLHACDVTIPASWQDAQVEVELTRKDSSRGGRGEERSMAGDSTIRVEADGRRRIWFDLYGTFRVRARKRNGGWCSSPPFEVEQGRSPYSGHVEIASSGRPLRIMVPNASNLGIWLHLVELPSGKPDVDSLQSFLRASLRNRGANLDSRWASARIGADQTASFDCVRPGTYGFLFGGRSGAPLSLRQIVVVKDDTEEILLDDVACGGIRGSVRSSSGGGVAQGIRIACCSSLGSCATTLTNESGEYAFVDVPTGQYRVTVWAPGSPIRATMGDTVLISDEHGNASIRKVRDDERDDPAVSVSAGRISVFDLVTEFVTDGEARGIVLLNGKPALGARVARLDTSGLESDSLLVDDDGRFRFRDVSGSKCTVSVEIGGIRWCRKVVTVRPAGNDEEPEFRIDVDGGVATVRVVGEDHAPVGGCLVGLSEISPAYRGVTGDERVSVHSASDANGLVTFDCLPASDYRIDVRANGFRRPEAWVRPADLRSGTVVDVNLARGGWARVHRSLSDVLAQVDGCEFTISSGETGYDGICRFEADGYAWIEVGAMASAKLTLTATTKAGRREVISCQLDADLTNRVQTLGGPEDR